MIIWDCVFGFFFDGSLYGVIWLIGLVWVFLGYVLVLFGWFVILGGSEGWVDEVFICLLVWWCGIGIEVLYLIVVVLFKGGVKVLYVCVFYDVDVI